MNNNLVINIYLFNKIIKRTFYVFCPNVFFRILGLAF